jgi:alkylation response protein AidB-like acyl-CoA dehydrogenase
MSELEAFRQEVRTWLEAEAPAALRGKGADLAWAIGGGTKVKLRPEQQAWLDMMGARGWTAPRWPREYGGGGLSAEQATVLTQEIARQDLPVPLYGMGLSMIGPTLLEYGTEEQKREHLPKIIRGELRWCQGYSEPNAGSDLASLQCSAVPDGDDFIVNGQKTWTSGGDVSDWMFMLVRTDTQNKHGGITFLLVEMDSPGIETKPIQLISGSSPFCETFFTDVRVPQANVVGRINDGWTVGKALLKHERSGLSLGGPTRHAEQSLADVARRYVGEAEGRIADPVLRDRIAALEIEQQCLAAMRKRSADNAKAGQPPGSETSLFKLCATELGQRRDELLLAIRGPQALGWDGEGFEKGELAHTRSWLAARATTIYGGTSEIQLNIIAKRVLRLPDDPMG